MKNKEIIELLNQINIVSSELKKLLDEKKEIMMKYRCAKTQVEKKMIEQEMKLSEFKFKKLNDESLELKNKIKIFNKS